MNRLASRLRAKAVALLGVSLFLVFFACRARAQDLDDVSFGGTVTDQNGAVIPGASVTATLLSTKSERTATTGGAGRDRRVELRPGASSVGVERVGFAVVERVNVSAVAGRSGRVG